ncbi:MAG: bifunctional 4-hydroxy-2-oxoglutarate aldolase/2-dehydro-3-deoxy-phosphogluconate aldolase [Prochlorococcus sp.]
MLASLRLQPLIVVLRPQQDALETSLSPSPILHLIEGLVDAGVQHLECAWSAQPGWLEMMEAVRQSFPGLSLGAASVTSSEALAAVVELRLAYGMAPCWNPVLQRQAAELNQLLIPGVFSPTEVHQASAFGCRILKLFPASTLGIDYWHQLTAPLGGTPFVIAAGGLKVADLSAWLAAGHDAVALGRGLVVDGQIDPSLHAWLRSSRPS